MDLPRTRATFGTTADEAQTTKALAFNQGFYNLFLAIVATVGIVAVASGHTAVGAALVFAGIGSMAPRRWCCCCPPPERARAAITQGTLPVLRYRGAAHRLFR